MRLFRLRDCWVPTRRGWLVIAAVLLSGMALVVGRLNAFLSPVSPVQADIMVLECWLSDSALKDASVEFRQGGYKRLIITGGNLPEAWQHQSKFKSDGELSRAMLALMGLDTNLMVVLPPPRVSRDRTYSAALGVRAYLKSSNGAVRAINLYTMGPHARRSRLLFEKALGSGIKVGVIAHSVDNYNTKRWWASTEGFQTVVSEAVAYLYARIWFQWAG